MTRLIVAAGGGGDAVAAAVLDAALYGGSGEPAVILTYAWDRLLVDPLPGPRGPDSFTGLAPLTRGVWTVPASARPIAPAGSTLPRLASELPHTFALLDPRHGAAGITHQLDALVRHLRPKSIDLLDVGGDILAKGDEPTLRSPLADALTLASCYQLDRSIRLLIAGPGLDGEIPAVDLADRMGPPILTLTADHIEPISAVLEWHPSEATGMLAATARGARGLCEVRDAGLPVPLTDQSPGLHEADLHQALQRNELARALLPTETLGQAEQRSRAICGYSEIDYERNKANWLNSQPNRKPDPTRTLHCLDEFQEEARHRGITHTTFRRITEALGIVGKQRQTLRKLLISHRPNQYEAPLWRISPGA
ncbi:hypothetical protein DEJ49_11155 [Streptomyces venezuelae]|uniref:DUF1152 domain-containing protein n=1 Tax=Streptomyces venezuelae TaxID=54571 RepID=A0A5P2CIL5_STRVZ|nr:DUF1152 domain-containing protein [Streptomyces venezuelae]QES41498.1 hypothetical protein DEJ49_11155 [Streptomyces venezuelae]